MCWTASDFLCLDSTVWVCGAALRVSVKSKGSLGFGPANYKWTEDERGEKIGLEILRVGGPWNPQFMILLEPVKSLTFKNEFLYFWSWWKTFLQRTEIPSSLSAWSWNESPYDCTALKWSPAFSPTTDHSSGLCAGLLLIFYPIPWAHSILTGSASAK